MLNSFIIIYLNSFWLCPLVYSLAFWYWEQKLVAKFHGLKKYYRSPGSFHIKRFYFPLWVLISTSLASCWSWNISGSTADRSRLYLVIWREDIYIFTHPLWFLGWITSIKLSVKISLKYNQLLIKKVKCVKLLSTLVGARGMLLEPEFQRCYQIRHPKSSWFMCILDCLQTFRVQMFTMAGVQCNKEDL